MHFLDVAMTIFISIAFIFVIGLVVLLGYNGVQYSKANYVVSDGENNYYVDEILSSDSDEYTMKCTDGSILTIYKPSIKEK